MNDIQEINTHKVHLDSSKNKKNAEQDLTQKKKKEI